VRDTRLASYLQRKGNYASHSLAHLLVLFKRQPLCLHVFIFMRRSDDDELFSNHLNDNTTEVCRLCI